MIFGVSNIGWNPNQNKEYFDLMIENGFSYIESVPSKVTKDVHTQALQSIFYETNIKSFNDIDECVTRFIEIINLSKTNYIKTIVVGSPKMRIAEKKNFLSVLREIDQISESVCICIEPNAKQYGGEYYHSIDEIVEDLSLFKNITTMLDTGNAIMEGENIFNKFERYSDYINHIHFSAPYNKPIVDYGIYKEFVSFLSERYKNKITYEFIGSESTAAHIRLFANNLIKGKR
jgi:sugar phosphate isomerase/epimerase